MAIHELSRNRRIGVLLICCLSLFIVGLDVTVVNVALPSIGQELHASISGLQWTVAAYTVVMASLLMFSGSTADRLGRKRTFVIGLTVFSVASLLCSLAPSVGLLVVFRVLQGVGASMLNPVAMSIVTNTFTEPRERAQAVGIWGAVFGISMALGPIVGGAAVSSVGWRSIFLINIPVGLAAIALTLRFIPESRALRPRRFDPIGQVLVVVLLATLTYGIIEAPSRGWTSPAIVAALSASGAALLGLLLYEPRREEPLIDLRFFRSIPFASSIVMAVAAFAAFGGFLFLNTLYLQEGRGLSPVRAGLYTVPMAVMMMLASPLSGRVVGRRGPRLPLVIAGGLPGDRVRHADRARFDEPLCAAVRGVRRLRARLRARQRTHHEHGRVRDAAGPGGRRRGDRHDLATGGADARRGGRRGDRDLARGRVGAGGPVLGEPPGLVDAHGLRWSRARARVPDHHRSSHRVGSPDGGSAQSGSARRIGSWPDGRTPWRGCL